LLYVFDLHDQSSSVTLATVSRQNVNLSNTEKEVGQMKKDCKLNKTGELIYTIGLHV
jgi:hypothetical protein